MAKSILRGRGRGRHRRYAGWKTLAVCLLVVSALSVGCSLDNPTSPNTASDLTGQTINQQFSFSGTIGVFNFTATVVADDTSTVTVTAEIRDSAGNLIPNLTQVTFTTNLGGFVVGVDTNGAAIVASQATASTFSGLASADFVSVGRATGTATVVASLGTVTGSTQLTLEPAPVSGTISAGFGTAPPGLLTKADVASVAAPLDVDVVALSLDDTVLREPIAGATVRFRIVSDTTDEGTGAPPAAFVADLDEVFSNTAGVANTRIRVQGPGDVVIAADLIDPNTGSVVSISNSLILTTTAGATSPTLSAVFEDDSTSISLGGTVDPASTSIIATAKTAAGAALANATVRFTITSDTTGTAILGGGGGTSATTTTGGDGTGAITVTLTKATQIVVIRVELLDSDGNVVAVGNDLVVAYD
jgi:hypothetical protein